MSEIIKYRAWIIPQRRMVRVAGLCFNDPVEVEVPKSGKENISIIDYGHPEHFEFWIKDKEAILLPCTLRQNLKDSTVYVGDIITWENDDMKKLVDNIEFQLTPSFNDFIVIGNIFENPELLLK